MMFNPLQVVYAVGAVVVVALVGTYIYKCESAMTFKERAVMLAEDAKKRAEKQAENDRDAKERSDAENTKLRTDLAVSDKRLRDERASRSRVPPAPTGSRRPDLATFDRAELERAMAHLDERGAGIAREGAAATVDLDTAKRWAASVARQP